MGLRINPRVAQRWVKDHYPRFRISAENEDILRLQDCPLCGNRKWAVRFNCQTQRLTCFRCQGKLDLFDMIKQAQGFTRLLDVYQYLKSYGDLTVTWHRQEGQDRLQAFKQVVKSVQPCPQGKGSLDLSDFSTDFSTEVGKVMLAYAVKRNIPCPLLESGRIGYFRPSKNKNPLVGRLAFLVYEDGQPVFAVGRAIRPGVDPKYLYPSAEFTGGRIAQECVYNIDAIQPGAVVPIAEGVISAISADPFCQAMLGNTLSRQQAGKLAGRGVAAYIILREQGISSYHAEESAARLWAKGETALIADLVDGDPNDNPEQMPQVIESARPTDRLSRLRAKLENCS